MWQIVTTKIMNNTYFKQGYQKLKQEFSPKEKSMDFPDELKTDGFVNTVYCYFCFLG